MNMFLKGALVFACAVSASVTSLRAEVTSVRVATQIGISYIPLIVMQHDKLWEAKAKEAGIDLTVEYAQLGGGAALNDALLSGAVQMVSGGIVPMLVLWDRTRNNYKVKGVSVVSTSPIDILTNDPRIQSLKDFGPKDRIAVPSVKVSNNAIALQMAAEKELGKWDALESLQVSMPHPQAYAALTLRSGEVTGYASSSPFQELALRQPGIRKLMSSYDVQGGPLSSTLIYAGSSFVLGNPKVMAAFMAAQKQAVAWIVANPKGAVEKYAAATGDKTDPALLEEILRKTMNFDMQPSRTKMMSDFLMKTGVLKTAPASWKDYFFDTVATGEGS